MPEIRGSPIRSADGTSRSCAPLGRERSLNDARFHRWGTHKRPRSRGGGSLAGLGPPPATADLCLCSACNRPETQSERVDTLQCPVLRNRFDDAIVLEDPPFKRPSRRDVHGSWPSRRSRFPDRFVPSRRCRPNPLRSYWQQNRQTASRLPARSESVSHPVTPPRRGRVPRRPFGLARVRRLRARAGPAQGLTGSLTLRLGCFAVAGRGDESARFRWWTAALPSCRTVNHSIQNKLQAFLS